MDVRANLTTNRIELEKVRPVAQKSEGVVDQRKAVQPTADAKDNPKERQEEDTINTQLADDDSTGCGDSNDGEKHILDVRV